MCNNKALIDWMSELPKEAAWRNGAKLLSYAFSFHSTGCKLTVRRINRQGTKEVAFIEDYTPRQCLQTLWSDTVNTQKILTWKPSKY